MVPVGDHHTLGVIDRFVFSLKRILTKQREITKSANWINTFDKVIGIYNKSDHRSLRADPRTALRFFLLCVRLGKILIS